MGGTFAINFIPNPLHSDDQDIEVDDSSLDFDNFQDLSIPNSIHPKDRKLSTALSLVGMPTA